MIDILDEVKKHLGESSKQTRARAGLTTGIVRTVSSIVFKQIADKSIENIFGLCERLLEERKWELAVVAYDWAFRMKRQYGEDTFDVFETWLKKYVRGWGDCDDFCTHAFGELLSQNHHRFTRILKWTQEPDFWVRRASAVILIYPIRKGELQGLAPFTIADRLMNDPHYLVLKGYGWMLKVLSTVNPDEVYDYLLKNKQRMPRVSFRYALEKMERERKLTLMEG